MTQRIEDLQGEISLAGGAAVNNLWQVRLPSLGEFDTRGMNLICRSVETPGRSINQFEHSIGLDRRQIVNAFGVTTMNLTFLVLNDGKVFEYFERWMNEAINQETYEIGYYDDHVYDIKIDVLKKGFSQSLFKKQFKLPIPSSIKNRLPNIGPINFRQGEVDLQLATDDKKIITYTMLDAYPSAIQGVTLNNEQATQFMELNVQFTFRNWTSTKGQTSEGDIFGKAINKVTEKLLDKIGF